MRAVACWVECFVTEAPGILIFDVTRELNARTQVSGFLKELPRVRRIRRRILANSARHQIMPSDTQNPNLPARAFKNAKIVAAS